MSDFSQPTEAQRRVMGYIRNNTGAVFSGSSKAEASAFIDKHIGASRRLRSARAVDAAAWDVPGMSYSPGGDW